MGSVLDYIDCPNCGHEAYDDFYYKTGEEYINCNNCGYHYSATIINREKKLNELTEADWEIKELKNPYGSYRIKHRDDVGMLCGSLIDEKQLTEMYNELIRMRDKIELFETSHFISGPDSDKNIQTKIWISDDEGPEYDGAGFLEEDR